MHSWAEQEGHFLGREVVRILSSAALLYLKVLLSIARLVILSSHKQSHRFIFALDSGQLGPPRSEFLALKWI